MAASSAPFEVLQTNKTPGRSGTPTPAAVFTARSGKLLNAILFLLPETLACPSISELDLQRWEVLG